MIAEKITDIKKFMSEFLIKNSFDDFLVNEITITTFNTYNINGYIKKDYYSKDEYEELGSPTLSEWRTLKPLCYEIIKGKKTPHSFKIILSLSLTQIEQFIKTNNIDFPNDNIDGLFLNIKYENNELTLITGTSLTIFTLDKTLEKAFDKYISNFISTLV